MKKLILIILLAFVIPSVSSASFDVSLKYGSRGVAVEELQDFLQDQGLYLGKIDGKLGLGTVRAIKLFQSANSLKPDGYFGLASRNKARILMTPVVATPKVINKVDDSLAPKVTPSKDDTLQKILNSYNTPSNNPVFSSECENAQNKSKVIQGEIDKLSTLSEKADASVLRLSPALREIDRACGLYIKPSPSALCNDGTYSYSKTNSGTCSYHGGVDMWF